MSGIPYWIESLVFSFRDAIVSRMSADRVIEFHFPDAAPADWTRNNSGFTAFNPAQRAFIREVFQYISSVIDVTFREVDTYRSFNTVVLANNNQGGSGSAGYMSGAPGDEAWGLFMSNVGSLASSFADPKANPSVINIYIHEIGHVLGLKHPFGNTLPILSDAEDNFDLTIMTYGSKSPGVGPPATIALQPLDIAALQYLYGPSRTHANARTDDTYALQAQGYNFIWDGGGIDTLDASQTGQRLTLDLRPLAHSFLGYTAQTLITSPGQITINQGSLIENVIGTPLDDRVTGNSAANTFWSRGGTDTFDGLEDTDTVVLDYARAAGVLRREGEDLAVLGPDGEVVRVRNVEVIRFSDVTLGVAELLAGGSLATAPYVRLGLLPDGVVTGAFTVDLRFSEPVVGLEASDFTISGAGVSALTGSGTEYTLTVKPTPGASGTVALQLNGAAVSTADGRANLKAQPTYLRFDTQALQLSPGPDAAILRNGDLILTFDDTVRLGAGEIVVSSTAGQEIERIAATDTSRIQVRGGTIYLDLQTVIAPGDTLSVTIPSGFLLDGNGNSIGYRIMPAANQIVVELGTQGPDSRNLGPASNIYQGLEGDDRIWGEEGGDSIDGGPGNDRLNGMQADDTLIGGEGNDTLIGHVGNDSLVGGDGEDTALYNVPYSTAQITRVGDVYIVVAGPDGTDRLVGVERLQFTDQTITLESAPDTTPPTLLSVEPSKGATGFAVQGDLTLRFSEAIRPGAGMIELRSGAPDGPLVQIFDAQTSTALTWAGSVLRINPSVDFTPGIRYFLNVPAGAVVDASGNPHGGLRHHHFLAAAQDLEAPQIIATHPPLFTSQHHPAQNIVILFDEPIVLTPGEPIELRTAAGVVVERYVQGSSARLTVAGNRLTIDPTDVLQSGAAYEVSVRSGWVRDAAGQAMPGGTVVIFTTSAQPGAIGGVANGAPTAAGATFETLEDTVLTGRLPAAVDPDGDAVYYSRELNALQGQVRIAVDGSFTYTPWPNFNGRDSFSFTVSDGQGGASTHVVTVTVGAVPDAPQRVGELDPRAGAVGAAWSFALPSDVFLDVESDPLQLSARLADGSALPAWLSFDSAAGLFTGTPPVGQHGRLSLAVTASDAAGSATARLELTIATGQMLTGTDAADLLAGGVGSDTLSAGAGHDQLVGGDGDDCLIGGVGNDSLTGGAGCDEAVFAGLRADHRIERMASGVLQVSGPDGVDQLVEVERLRFQDRAMAFDEDGVGGQAYRLYKAAFNREPDAAGVGFWMHHLDRGFDRVQAAAHFLNSDEFRALYDSDPATVGFQEPTIEQFVTRLYRNVLQRDPEGPGYQFWVDAMNNKDGAFGKAWSRAEVLLQFAESGENRVKLLGTLLGGFEYLPYTASGG